MELLDFTALELGEKIKKGEVGVEEATRAALDRIKEAEPSLHSYVSVQEEAALERAREVQQGIREGVYTSPLAGVPAGIKDNICTKGVATTCSSRMLENFLPTYNATAYEHLLQAGVVPLGKTNMDEFAMGSTTETA